MDFLGVSELTIDQLNTLVFYLGAVVIFLFGVIVTLCICSRQDIVAGCSNVFLWYFLLPTLLVTVTYNSHSAIENVLHTYGLKLEDPNDFYHPPSPPPPPQSRKYYETEQDNRETSRTSDILVPKRNFFRDLVDFAYRDDPPQEQENKKDQKECLTETIEDTNEKGDRVIKARIKCV